jgi:hypothetical protein
LSLS